MSPTARSTCTVSVTSDESATFEKRMGDVPAVVSVGALLTLTHPSI